MRWTHKIMSNNPDDGNSRLSSRSLSKFKKINLQKSQAQISSNDNLEKSELKLNTVQKIKVNHLNQSYISNYVYSYKPTQNPSPFSNEKNHDTSIYQHQQTNNNFSAFNSEKVKAHQIQSQKKHQRSKGFEGFALFRKDTQKSVNNFESSKQFIPTKTNQFSLSYSQQKLKIILQKMRSLFVQFKEISSTIKGQLQESALLIFQKMESCLGSYLKEFSSKLEEGIQNLMKIKKAQDFPSSVSDIQPKNQAIFPNLKSGGSSIFNNLANQVIHQSQKERQNQVKNRPNQFKNKFKQLIDNTDYNSAPRSQNTIDKQKLKKNSQSNEKSITKLSRKRNNHTQRLNSLLDNDSSFLNQNSINQDLDESTTSIKFCRINERSATKQGNKIKQKITMIKTIFRPSTAQSGGEQQSINLILKR